VSSLVLDDALQLADELTRTTSLAAEVAAVRDRLGRPLRVAIAGRAKAGKSTLLNALVGERLAATDATECTRIVTWYRFDLGYSVVARLRGGDARPLEFDRADGAVRIRLGGLGIDEIERIEVGWPSSRLANLTLIDTPGLDSTSAATAQRTIDALIGDDATPGDADAVIYLMRHLHRRDAEFLEAFELPVAPASPVNAVAVLSRADEIGGGRLDALDAAAAIAGRYGADPRVAALALTVLPLAALLAETGASLRESDAANVRALAALPPTTIDTLLLSVDRFRERPENPLRPEEREALLRRLGLFGLRRAVGTFRAGPGMTSGDLSRELIDASGIRALESLLRRQFAERADALKTRSALAALKAVAARATRAGLSGADGLFGALERIEDSSPQLAELRALHLVHAGIARVSPAERAEIDAVLGTGGLAERLGLAPRTLGDLDAVPMVVAAIDRWRTNAADPVRDRAAVEVAETVARAYEGLYHQLTR
jgi:hypothetical protein